MEYNKNKKKFSVAFKSEVALKTVSNKVQINYSSTICSKNEALVQNGLNTYGVGVARTKMELFADIVNGFKPLTIFARELRLRCLIGSSYASDLGIYSTCTFIDYSARLLEFVLFV